MKQTHVNRRQSVRNPIDEGAHARGEVRAVIARAKEAMLFQHMEAAGDHGRLLKLALNEAEALAWQTEFPQLVFPILAEEKARAAVSWHERQHALRRAQAEVAFAE